VTLTRSTCAYCGVGCGVLIESEGERITGVRGDPEHPANFGKLCSKGSTLHLTAAPHLRATRALHPELRATRAALRERVSWDTAIDHVATRIADITLRHGPDAVAFYISGQLLTEDYYVFNKLAKGLLGTNNIDTNSRLCMSSAVAGYKMTLGTDAPPCAYEDLDHAECVLIAGSNTAFAHPVLYRRLEAARAANPQMKVIVVDPRRTDTAREADLFLQILPGSDVALFHGMLHVLLWEGLIDAGYIERHTSGFDTLKSLVREYTPAHVAALCGIVEADLIQAAKWFGQARASLSLYCQGLNQSTSGTAKNAGLINLHLATGQIGKPGAGPFSLTGQPNAMGGREVGGMANLLSAHRDLSNPQHRAQVAALWGVPAVPERPGKTAVEMFDALAQGSIKAVWIACTNPAQSLPDQARVREALARAELVVLQEAYRNTECAPYADVLLPAATWGEKEGTVTNSERRITRVRAAIPPPGEARADWEIAVAVAQRIEALRRADSPGSSATAAPSGTLFPYRSPEEVWNEHRESTRGRDLDITGMSYRLLEATPLQWPMPEGAREGAARLYCDGRYPTSDTRARFVALPYRPVAEPVDARYPFRLNTGRLRDQWHSMSRTGTLAQLYGHAPEPRLEMHPADLARRGLAEGDLLCVSSRRGQLHVPVSASQSVAPGQAWLPMHWGSRFLGGAAAHGVNSLTQPACDPYSRQPELKHAAIRVSKADLPWRLAVFGYPPAEGEHAGSAIDLLDRLAAHMTDAVFASAALIGRAQEGVLLRMADKAPPPSEVLQRIDTAFGLTGDQVIRYDDPRRKVGRRLSVAEGRLMAVRLSGELTDLAAEPWLKDWLTGGVPVEPIRRLLLLPSAKAPAGAVAQGRVVCTCWNVSETAIDACLAGTPPTADPLDHLQASLKCGTNCGSCLPELKALCQAVARERLGRLGASDRKAATAPP
jgi:assimilatory nitrate reductase catalytic subunit